MSGKAPKVLVAVGLLFVLSSGCTSLRSSAEIKQAFNLTDDERHRLYAAALAASDSPLDTNAFQNVCHTIGIFDSNGKPNDQYMNFVSQHVAWGTNSSTEEFRQQINSREKALQYISKHLPND